MISICDVTLRDGLQSIDRLLSIDQKFEILKQLISVGVERFEFSSFVSPIVVPQLADATEFSARIIDNKLMSKYTTCLILNEFGSKRAIEAGAKFQTLVVSTSNSFSIRNSGQSLSELNLSIARIAKSIQSAGGRFRGSISMSFGEHGEDLPLEAVLHNVELLSSLGAFEVSIADTTGQATVESLSKLLDSVKEAYPHVPINLHFHGKGNSLLELTVAALERGVNSFDLSLLGVGGCPNIDHRFGNLSYSIFISACKQCGRDLPLDIHKLNKLENYFSKITC
ncbi:MAG: hypothetical protein KAG61_04715 [Bacteriovoracaceae bacterium]|nr:hypothetical protein [Bacteriovoracaceae bacterium]